MTKVAGQDLLATQSAVTAGNGSVLQFSGGVLKAGTDVQVRAASIDTIRFELEQKGSEYLLFCTVYRADSGAHYTFCVNPREGETVGAG